MNLQKVTLLYPKTLFKRWITPSTYSLTYKCPKIFIFSHNSVSVISVVFHKSSMNIESQHFVYFSFFKHNFKHMFLFIKFSIKYRHPIIPLKVDLIISEEQQRTATTHIYIGHNNYLLCFVSIKLDDPQHSCLTNTIPSICFGHYNFWAVASN